MASTPAPLFSDLFPFKIWPQNLIDEKTTLESHFCEFWVSPRAFSVKINRFGVHLGSILGASGIILRCSLEILFLTCFLRSFCTKKSKSKTWRSSFRYVKYVLSWGSPCWTKTSTAVKKNIAFLTRISWKSTWNRWEIWEKRCSPPRSIRNWSMTASRSLWGNTFSAPGCFLVNLWVRLGSQNRLFRATYGQFWRLFGHLLRHMWFFFAQGCSGSVPRPIWDVLETLLERILGGFLAILCIASVIRGVLVSLQLRPKFAPISNQSLFCRRCLAVLCRPSVAGATIVPSVLNNLIFWSRIHCVNSKAGLILYNKWKTRKNSHSCIAIFINRCLPSRGGRHEP